MIQIQTLNKKESPMNKTFRPESASSTPRVLIGFVFSSIGVLLALLAFVAFPSSSALARPKCPNITFFQHSDYYGGPIYDTLTCNENPCTGYIVFYTIGTNPPDPTHDGGGNPTGTTLIYNQASEGIGVARGTERYIKALSYKPYPWVDSDITEDLVDNTVP
jgi:hypothetical protein